MAAAAIPTVDAVVCVTASLILAYVPHWIRAFGVVVPKLKKEGKPYDLRYPRLSTERSTDDTETGKLIARLTGCHQNGLEAFASFGVAVCIALARGVHGQQLDRAATAFIAIRVLYMYLYINGTRQRTALARLLSWTAGFGATLYILNLARGGGVKA